MSNSFSPSTILDRARAPRALVTTLLTSAVITPHRWHFTGSTRNSKCDWPRIWKMPTSTTPGTLCRMSAVFVARSSSLSMSGPKILTELSPLIPERASMTLSRMFCEKFQKMPGSLRSSSASMSRTISSLVRAHRAKQPLSPTGRGDGFRPVLFRTERDEVFTILVSRRVGCVVRPPQLVDDRLHFGIGRHDGPGLGRDLRVRVPERCSTGRCLESTSCPPRAPA